MKIERRIAIALSVSLLLGDVLAGYISYALEARQSREEARQNAELVLAAAMAVRGYTADEIEPLLKEPRADESFHPQIIPFYAAQATIGRINEKVPAFSYREVAPNPTNVSDRATDWEIGVLRQLREQSAAQIAGETGSGQDARFFVARPIRVDSPACLSCHGKPDLAPKALLAKYGSGAGFGWNLDDVIGLQIVEIPYAPARSRALHSVLVTVGSVTCLMVLAATLLLVLIRRHVLKPLEIITRDTEVLSLAAPGAKQPAIPAAADPQLIRLMRAIGRLRTSIALASSTPNTINKADNNDRDH